MRADRLVAILLLLQRRGQVTAAEVAEELEVSERTARRDLDALAMAGLPVYSQQGRGGGWRLAGGGRTDLSGLSADETRALFLLAGPRAVSAELRAALRKLVRALPEPMRDRAEAAADAVVIDPQGWGGPGRFGGGPGPAPAAGPEPPHLRAVQDAVIDASQVWLDYVDREGTVTRRAVDPYGVVAKGHRWYLVAGTADGRRTFRVDRVRGVQATGATVVRPDGFDLAQVWRDIAATVDELRLPVRARVLADPWVVRILRQLFDTRLTLGPAGPDGRVELEVRGWAERSLAIELAGFGSWTEVLEPISIRRHLADVGAALTRRYGPAEPIPVTPEPAPPGRGRGGRRAGATLR
jgi:predicted DNA-binding transcriptional regulator YafY